ncbi:hypothetical protein EDD86DRAFT_246066 [Gorgonomyces haynaldii]|nr:hypothetical protein EDD86DRAFT_246066 [Gorgonomyces haynaldii]
MQVSSSTIHIALETNPKHLKPLVQVLLRIVDLDPGFGPVWKSYVLLFTCNAIYKSDTKDEDYKRCKQLIAQASELAQQNTILRYSYMNHLVQLVQSGCLQAVFEKESQDHGLQALQVLVSTKTPELTQEWIDRLYQTNTGLLYLDVAFLQLRTLRFAIESKHFDLSKKLLGSLNLLDFKKESLYIGTATKLYQEIVFLNTNKRPYHDIQIGFERLSSAIVEASAQNYQDLVVFGSVCLWNLMLPTLGEKAQKSTVRVLRLVTECINKCDGDVSLLGLTFNRQLSIIYEAKDMASQAQRYSTAAISLDKEKNLDLQLDTTQLRIAAKYSRDPNSLEWQFKVVAQFHSINNEAVANHCHRISYMMLDFAQRSQEPPLTLDVTYQQLLLLMEMVREALPCMRRREDETFNISTEMLSDAVIHATDLIIGYLERHRPDPELESEFLAWKFGALCKGVLTQEHIDLEQFMQYVLQLGEKLIPKVTGSGVFNLIARISFISENLIYKPHFGGKAREIWIQMLSKAYDVVSKTEWLRCTTPFVYLSFYYANNLYLHYQSTVKDQVPVQEVPQTGKGAAKQTKETNNPNTEIKLIEELCLKALEVTDASTNALLVVLGLWIQVQATKTQPSVLETKNIFLRSFALFDGKPKEHDPEAVGHALKVLKDDYPGVFKIELGLRVAQHCRETGNPYLALGIYKKLLSQVTHVVKEAKFKDPKWPILCKISIADGLCKLLPVIPFRKDASFDMRQIPHLCFSLLTNAVSPTLDVDTTSRCIRILASFFSYLSHLKSCLPFLQPLTHCLGAVFHAYTSKAQIKSSMDAELQPVDHKLLGSFFILAASLYCSTERKEEGIKVLDMGIRVVHMSVKKELLLFKMHVKPNEKLRGIDEVLMANLQNLEVSVEEPEPVKIVNNLILDLDCIEMSDDPAFAEDKIQQSKAQISNILKQFFQKETTEQKQEERKSPEKKKEKPKKQEKQEKQPETLLEPQDSEWQQFVWPQAIRTKFRAGTLENAITAPLLQDPNRLIASLLKFVKQFMDAPDYKAISLLGLVISGFEPKMDPRIMDVVKLALQKDYVLVVPRCELDVTCTVYQMNHVVQKPAQPISFDLYCELMLLFVDALFVLEDTTQIKQTLLHLIRMCRDADQKQWLAVFLQRLGLCSAVLGDIQSAFTFSYQAKQLDPVYPASLCAYRTMIYSRLLCKGASDTEFIEMIQQDLETLDGFQDSDLNSLLKMDLYLVSLDQGNHLERALSLLLENARQGRMHVLETRLKRTIDGLMDGLHILRFNYDLREQIYTLLGQLEQFTSQQSLALLQQCRLWILVLNLFYPKDRSAEKSRNVVEEYVKELDQELLGIPKKQEINLDLESIEQLKSQSNLTPQSINIFTALDLYFKSRSEDPEIQKETRAQALGLLQPAMQSEEERKHPLVLLLLSQTLLELYPQTEQTQLFYALEIYQASKMALEMDQWETKRSVIPLEIHSQSFGHRQLLPFQDYPKERLQFGPKNSPVPKNTKILLMAESIGSKFLYVGFASQKTSGKKKMPNEDESNVYEFDADLPSGLWEMDQWKDFKKTTLLTSSLNSSKTASSMMLKDKNQKKKPEKKEAVPDQEPTPIIHLVICSDLYGDKMAKTIKMMVPNLISLSLEAKTVQKKNDKKKEPVEVESDSLDGFPCSILYSCASTQDRKRIKAVLDSFGSKFNGPCSMIKSQEEMRACFGQFVFLFKGSWSDMSHLELNKDKTQGSTCIILLQSIQFEREALALSKRLLLSRVTSFLILKANGEDTASDLEFIVKSGQTGGLGGFYGERMESVPCLLYGPNTKLFKD